MSAPPRFIQPCAPIRAKTVPAGGAWTHEPKLDGYRLQIIKDGPRVRLYSRNGTEWTRRLRSLAEALAAFPARSAVIDAELCLPGAEGGPDFVGLQAALSSRRHGELAVFAFDLMHRDGADLRPLALHRRRALLSALTKRADVACLHLVPAGTDGLALFAAAERHGLEGIVSKRSAAPYTSGECRDWVKVKTLAWREANRERWRGFQR